MKAICEKLNPIIRGWANYFRYSAATETVTSFDHWMFQRCKLHVRGMHPKKSWGWKKPRYWGRLHPKRADNWVFGDTHGKTFYLRKFWWTPIERHVMVKSTSSPDDPTLEDYWAKRRMAKASQIVQWDKRALALKQRAKCPVCGESVVEDEADGGVFATEETHRHHRKPKGKGGSDDLSNRVLVHLYCHQKAHTDLKLLDELGVPA